MYALFIFTLYTVFDQSIRSSEGCHLPSAIRRLSFATNNAIYRTCSDGGGQRTALPYLIFTLTLNDRNNNSPSHQVGKYE